MTPESALARGLGELDLALPGGAAERLLAYARLMAKWNRVYNLTAIRQPEQMVTHHLLDSLAVLAHLPPPAEPSLADVGSGGGLPGVPIAIARPGWRVVLNDRSQKKCAFLRQAVIELGLTNVSVHAGRVEEWRPVQRFAIVIARAFAELGALFAACRHLLAPRGVLAAMKGGVRAAELAQLPAGCRCGQPIRLSVPLLRAERHLVLCSEAS